MIAHAFPPAGGSGVQRTLKFAKYLPQFGWTPIVCTTDVVENLPRDESLLPDLPPEVRILRFSQATLMKRFRNHISRAAHCHSDDESGKAGVFQRFRAALHWRTNRLIELRDFPDDCAAWGRRCFRGALSTIEHNRIDAIYSTFSPATNHLVALQLKKRTGLPWVADFRDLWTDDFRYRPRSERFRKKHRRFEQEILDVADVVVGVTPSQTEILANRARGDRSKFATITNGFDPDDFLNAPRTRPGNKGIFRLCHVGRFAMNCTPPEWFEGLSRFTQSLGEKKSLFELRIVGSYSNEAQAQLHQTGAEVVFVDYVSHVEAIAEMQRADALLLMMPDRGTSGTVIPGKMFEYLAAGRPILSVGASGGECARIASEAGAGLVARQNAIEISSRLSQLFEAWRAASPLPGCQAGRCEEFSRVRLTGLLAEKLESIRVKHASLKKESNESPFLRGILKRLHREGLEPSTR